MILVNVEDLFWNEKTPLVYIEVVLVSIEVDLESYRHDFKKRRGCFSIKSPFSVAV